jgi:hypothetical protein
MNPVSPSTAISVTLDPLNVENFRIGGHHVRSHGYVIGDPRDEAEFLDFLWEWIPRLPNVNHQMSTTSPTLSNLMIVM